MRSDITPGRHGTIWAPDLVMDGSLPQLSVLLADRGHDPEKVCKTMEARDVVPVVLMRKSRRLWIAVERCFNKLKNAGA